MDYEKKYKDALERARVCHKDLSNLIGTTASMAKDFFEEVFPELHEPQGEKIRKEIIEYIKENVEFCDAWVDWLQSIPVDPVSIEHGKYYYCINDYYAGGKKLASKGDVVLALRGMSMMSLSDEDATKLFLPVNDIKQYECKLAPDADQLDALHDMIADYKVHSKDYNKDAISEAVISLYNKLKN